MSPEKYIVHLWKHQIGAFGSWLDFKLQVPCTLSTLKAHNYSHSRGLSFTTSVDLMVLLKSNSPFCVLAWNVDLKMWQWLSSERTSWLSTHCGFPQHRCLFLLYTAASYVGLGLYCLRFRAENKILSMLLTIQRKHYLATKLSASLWFGDWAVFSITIHLGG